MPEFDYYFDDKVTIWSRTKCTLEAENETEAQLKLKKLVEENNLEKYAYDWQLIDESIEFLSVGDNNGEHTREVYFENNTEPDYKI